MEMRYVLPRQGNLFIKHAYLGKEKNILSLRIKKKRKISNFSFRRERLLRTHYRWDNRYFKTWSMSALNADYEDLDVHFCNPYATWVPVLLQFNNSRSHLWIVTVNQAMCAVVVSQTSCNDRNHPILRGVIATYQDFFFFAKITILLDFESIFPRLLWWNIRTW